jgi:hypothetical protein
VVAAFAGFLVRLLFYVLFFGTPVVGFWVASSLAAYLGAPPWMAWTAGALLFPIVPGIWELRSWASRRPGSKPFLTPLDRLSLRTFVVGLAFLIVLLTCCPQAAFVALSTRGDWVLDQVKDSRADKVRQALFAAAGGLEWLYRATKYNPYKAHIDSVARQQTEEAEKQVEQETAHQHDEESPKRDLQESLPPDKQKAEDSTLADGKWPWKDAALHPAVVSMPASAEESIESVAKYIAAKEKDPTLRIKALHDYVADRVAYDSDALYSGNIPDQSAETTFRTRKSVCAGYANLLAALADSIDEKIIVVSGDARDHESTDKLSGMGHAWNAARIGSRWYLIDACWDAGYVSREKGFTKSYRTDYLLPPPEVMIADHFPEKTTWQLLAKPLSQGEFLRQPMLDPSFRAADLALVDPQRATNETGSKATVLLKNPKSWWLMSGLEQNGKEIDKGSRATRSNLAQLEYALPDKGRYTVNMYVNKESEFGQYEYVGSVDFVNR